MAWNIRYTPSLAAAVNTVRSPVAGALSFSGVAPSVSNSAALADGAALTVSGFGAIFGSKSGVTKIYDDCSGSDPATLWDIVPPTTGSMPLDYRTVAGAGRGVALPHSNITQYLCGAHNLNTASGGQVVYVAKNFSKPSFPYYSYWSWFCRLDPNWVHDPGGEPSANHKFYGFSTGNGTIYNLPDNWYLEFKGGTGFISNTSDAQWHCVDDAPGAGHTQGIAFHAGFGGAQPNPCGAWVKRELLIKWQSNSTGFLKGWANNQALLDEAGYTDAYPFAIAGDLRAEGIEGFAGNYNSNNVRYMADVMYMRGSHIGRFVVTDNATYASASIAVVQDYSTWDATNPQLIIRKGNHTSGTKHLWYRDEVNGHQYCDTLELA